MPGNKASVRDRQIYGAAMRESVGEGSNLLCAFLPCPLEKMCLMIDGITDMP
jgi:hypothetical protein